ncbi:Angio-associated migratory cell protein [Aphelenchoides bicaudatus]|nr:Angio-associated migratory cell protein [Aphelenchoides bicaudatus]
MADQNDEEMIIDENEDNEMEDVDDEEFEIPDDSVLKLSVHTKDVFCLAISPQNNKLLTGSEDDKAIVWNINGFKNTGQIESQIIDLHKDSVLKVNFNHNGTLFATADMLGKIFIFDAITNAMLYEVDYCDDIEWTVWHHSFNVLFAGTSSGSVHMFLLSKTQIEQNKIYVTDTNSPCTGGQLLADGKHLICVYGDGRVLLWNLKDSTNSNVNLGSPCTTLDLHSSLPLAAVGTEDGLASLINTNNMNVVSRLGRPNDPNAEEEEQATVETVKFAPHNYPWIAVGTNDGILTIYDINSSQPRYECTHDKMAIVKCDWLLLPDDKLRILTACFDGGLRGWDARSGDPVFFKHTGGQIFDFLTTNIEGTTFLFAACAEGFLRVFNYEENVEDADFKSLFVETEPAMSYQMYRITTLGEALEQTLNELQEEGHIPKEIIPRVMAAEKLRAYRFCDNVWTFLMNSVEFRDNLKAIEGPVDRVKVVACDASMYYSWTGRFIGRLRLVVASALQCYNELPDKIEEMHWEKLVHDENVCVYRRWISSLYTYEYRCAGSYKDISADNFFRAQMDIDYRKKWDANVLKLDVLEKRDPDVEIVRWVHKFPRPMSARIYIYLRRTVFDEKNQSLQVDSEALSEKEWPSESIDKSYVRVTVYKSRLNLYAHSKFTDKGFDYVLTYYDYPKASIPGPAYNWIVNYGGHYFLKDVHQAAKKLSLQDVSK